MYIRRELERTLDVMLGQGKVVLVTGARQVGKTTMLREHLGGSFSYVSMDDPGSYLAAQQDALLFFDSQTLPLIIDEVQRVPGLFPTVKFVVDKSTKKGQIVLTGSQTYHLMKGVSESLAGRIRILELSGLSLRELAGRADAPRPYLPAPLSANGAQPPVRPSAGTDDIPAAGERGAGAAGATSVGATPTEDAGNAADLWRVIHRGSLPALQDPSMLWEPFYADYLRSYIERDVRDLLTVRDEAQFYRFVVACAARSGQLFNASDVADVVGVDRKTVSSWLSVLQASGLVRILEPFWPNLEKRLTKMPKLYFMDTGLVCYLTRWMTPDQLRVGAAAGHVFETFVVSEVLKSYLNAGRDARDVSFYRDSKKREIDLIVQDGHTLHPVEIKSGMLVREDAVRSFSCLEGLAGYEVGFGHVICQTERPYMITRDVQAVPVWGI